MARALTAPELVHLRSNGQRCRLFLAIPTPATIFSARLNGIPASTDKVAEITFDGGSAGFANCIPGQTVYVGSATGAAGAYDVGIVRLRGTIAGTTGTMKIGETSEIDWTDNNHLTVVDEFALWPRHLRITGAGVVYVDYDVAYSGQHADCDPVPVLGPPAIKWLTGATVDVDFDGSDSWVSGSTIFAYSWAAPGASATSGTATATPTITYDAAGEYRVSCLVTATNGKTFTGYRRVFVYDDDNMPATVFRLDDCAGDWQGGGFRFRVTMSDEATRVEMLDRTQVVLFARDWYGSTEISIGPVADRENVVAVGWIDGESIDWHPEQGKVSFDVQGPQFWMDKMTGFPAGVEDYDGTPTDWVEFEDLTVDKGLWHFLHWRTTATLCTDVSLTGDTRQIKVFDSPSSSLWQQITQESERTILAHPASDRYGRIFVEIDQNLIPVADRGVVPVVQPLAKQDWQNAINIERRTVAESALLDMSGMAYAGGSATPYFSLSPGHVFKRYGSVQRQERLALSNQADANELAGLLAGKANNEYPNLDIQMASNYRAVDICPRQYLTLTIAAGDTERGISFTDYPIIPRRVSFRYDPSGGVLLTDITAEGYTLPELAVTGDPPPAPPDPPDPPDIPPIPLPPPVELWTGPVKAAIAWNGEQIGYTADLLRHQVVSTGKAGTTGTTLIDTSLDDQPTADFDDVEVEIGDVVENIATRVCTTVAAVVSGTQLTLTADIGLTVGSDYHICGAEWHDALGSVSGGILQLRTIRTGASTVAGWVVTTTGVYYASNVLTSSPSWSEKLDLATIRADTGVSGDATADFRGIAVDILNPNFVAVHLSHNRDISDGAGQVNGGVAYSSDLGGTWDYATLANPVTYGFTGWSAFARPTAGYGGIEIVEGVAYIECGPVDALCWKSTDGCANFIPVGTLGTTPYDDSQFTFHGVGGSLYASVRETSTRLVRISTDAGVNWATVDPAGYAHTGNVNVVGDYDNGATIIASFVEAGVDDWLMRSVTSGGSWTVLARADNLFGANTALHTVAPIVPWGWPWPPDAGVFAWVDRYSNGGIRITRYMLYLTLDYGSVWLNKMGDWYTVFSNWWSGAYTTYGSAYAGLIPLPRVGANE